MKRVWIIGIVVTVLIVVIAFACSLTKNLGTMGNTSLTMTLVTGSPKLSGTLGTKLMVTNIVYPIIAASVILYDPNMMVVFSTNWSFGSLNTNYTYQAMALGNYTLIVQDVDTRYETNTITNQINLCNGVNTCIFIRLGGELCVELLPNCTPSPNPGGPTPQDLIETNHSYNYCVQYIPDRFGLLTNGAACFYGYSYLLVTNFGPLVPGNSVALTHAISLWFKTTQNSSLADFFIAGAGDYKGWLVGLTSQKVSVGGANGSWTIVNGSRNVSDNNWHHLAVNFIGGTNIMAYLDNSLEIVTAINYTTAPGFTNTMGKNFAYNCQYYTGCLDDVIVFNYALSPSDINTLFLSSQF